MAKYAKLHDVFVPQNEPLDERQIPNHAGGFVYGIDDWKRLERFLILGSDSNTYYQKARALTKENSQCVIRCWNADHARTASTIAQISDTGRAPKNDPAIWALALGTVNPNVEVRRSAFAAVKTVCRTSTHLFQFLGDCRVLGKGWGRAMKRTVANWYNDHKVDSIGYQMIKYRSRGGYTHKRALELAHVPGKDRTPLYRWAKGKADALDPGELPHQVEAHIHAMDASGKDLLALIRDYKLPWEAIPTAAKADPKVWRAMLPDMGVTAMIRNLGVMTANEAIKPLSKEAAFVSERLGNTDQLKRARVHPFTLLQALVVYRSGAGFRGSKSWEPIAPICDALEQAYYKAFSYLEPTGKRILIGLDVSGSMSSPFIGSPLRVCEAAAAMAMTFMRTEKQWVVMAFAGQFLKLPLRANMALEDVLKMTGAVNFGSTDCSLPMLYAKKKDLDVDVFLVITDNETWVGEVHPSQALQDYRQHSGIDTKLIVMGMTATECSIADPADPGMLDVVGMDSSVPELVTNFARQ